VNRPQSPPVGKPGVYGEEIGDYLAALTYDPNFPPPPRLADIQFHRVSSCTAVRENIFDADDTYVGGAGRHVEMAIWQLEHSVGTEEANGSHAGPILDKLSATDRGNIQSFLCVSKKRADLSMTTPPPFL
jgi:hypothetical protein